MNRLSKTWLSLAFVGAVCVAPVSMTACADQSATSVIMGNAGSAGKNVMTAVAGAAVYIWRTTCVKASEEAVTMTEALAKSPLTTAVITGVVGYKLWSWFSHTETGRRFCDACGQRIRHMRQHGLAYS